MTRSVFFSIAALVLVAALGTADEPKDKSPVQPADKEMKGTWIPVEGMVEGQKLPENHLATTKLILNDGKYNVVVGEEKEDGTYKVDSSKKPVTVDITPVTGPNKGKMIPAIIELSGDTMKVCYNLMGQDRPKDFNSTATNKFVVMTYKRDKPKEPEKGKDK